MIKNSRGPPPLLFIAFLVDKVLTPEIFKMINLKNVGVFEMDGSAQSFKGLYCLKI